MLGNETPRPAEATRCVGGNLAPSSSLRPGRSPSTGSPGARYCPGVGSRGPASSRPTPRTSAAARSLVGSGATRPTPGGPAAAASGTGRPGSSTRRAGLVVPASSLPKYEQEPVLAALTSPAPPSINVHGIGEEACEDSQATIFVRIRLHPLQAVGGRPVTPGRRNFWPAVRLRRSAEGMLEVGGRVGEPGAAPASPASHVEGNGAPATRSGRVGRFGFQSLYERCFVLGRGPVTGPPATSNDYPGPRTRSALFRASSMTADRPSISIHPSEVAPRRPNRSCIPRLRRGRSRPTSCRSGSTGSRRSRSISGHARRGRAIRRRSTTVFERKPFGARCARCQGDLRGRRASEEPPRPHPNQGIRPGSVGGPTHARGGGPDSPDRSKGASRAGRGIVARRSRMRPDVRGCRGKSRNPGRAASRAS